MDVARFRRVQELFSDAVDRGGAAREDYLVDACDGDAELRAEVERLLRAHESNAGFFAESRPLGESPGDLIGRYKLLEPIGEGGFGVVWMAEQQEPVVRRVALKVVKPGMDTRDVLTRFEAERQAIAIMDHPNIARVLDAGATPQGRPFFAMELVHGVPLLEFADRECLTASARLELFVQVCSAVQHAHQKGIVHRDLKPSNVMVTMIDGAPVCKVIDFGIAKATERRLVEKTMFTAYGRFLGTPEYMAPEQTEISGLDVDTRADVYSLGVLLYELLTGTRPIEFAAQREQDYLEFVRAVRDVDPPKPSTRVSTLGDRGDAIAAHRHTTTRQLGLDLRGDLDWVVMRALEKDRRRRYQTVSALADDVHRSLRDEPVTAGPPSVGYKLRKFVARNRALVASMALIAISLLTGLGLAIHGYVTASRARDDAVASAAAARLEADKSNAVVGLMSELLSAANPHAARGADFTVRELLEEFDGRLEDELADVPEVEAELRTIVGVSFSALGLPRDAERQYERALALREASFGAADMRSVDVVARIAAAAFASSDLERAERLFLQVLDARREALGSQDPRVAETLAALAEVASERGELDRAESLQREALAIRRAHFAPRSFEVAKSMNDLAAVLAKAGAGADALALWTEACDIMLEVAGPDHPNTLTARTNLALARQAHGEFEASEAELRAVIDSFRRVSGAVHPSVAMGLRNLAVVLMQQSDFAAAEPVLREAVSIWEQLDARSSSANARQDLGTVLLRLGRASEAEGVLREALDLYRAADVPNTDPRVRWVLHDLREAQQRRGDGDEVR